MARKLADYYKLKGVILRVLDTYRAEVEMTDSGDVLQAGGCERLSFPPAVLFAGCCLLLLAAACAVPLPTHGLVPGLQLPLHPSLFPLLPSPRSTRPSWRRSCRSPAAPCWCSTARTAAAAARCRPSTPSASKQTSVRSLELLDWRGRVGCCVPGEACLPATPCCFSLLKRVPPAAPTLPCPTLPPPPPAPGPCRAARRAARVAGL